MIKAPEMTSKDTALFFGGCFVGALVGAAAKTIVALAIPAGLAITAGVIYWKRRKANS